MTPATLIRTGAALLILSAPLAACGKLGQLERPGPLNGASPPPNRQAQDPRPIDTVDPRDAVTAPAPPRTLPIGGSGEDVTRSGPPGALPDPYANPR
ncbi:MAG TPA: hypothetical protein VFE10_07575 [Phenylobacterium sp.]|jgi:predicted small lipoprotein YifL|nr:hypothetical protein [Phenylobacterium sp.]